MEVTNRFKGLYLVDRVPEKLWTEFIIIVQEAVTKTIPKKINVEIDHVHGLEDAILLRSQFSPSWIFFFNHIYLFSCVRS